DLPVPAQNVSGRAWGLRPREPCCPSRWRCSRWYLPPRPWRRRLDLATFRGSIPSPPFPLSTLRRRPHERLRMTRGRCGSLLLHRAALASATPCRSSRRTDVGCGACQAAVALSHLTQPTSPAAGASLCETKYLTQASLIGMLRTDG